MAKPVVVITNVASPIGRACAKAFADRGARLILSDADEPAGREFADVIADRASEVSFVCGDHQNRLHVHNIIAEALETFNRIDVAICAPAVRPREDLLTAFHEISEDDLRSLGISSVWGALVFNQAMIRQFLKQAIDMSDASDVGVIVNIGFAESPAFGRPLDSAANAGLYGMSRALGAAYSSSGIRVNAVCASTVAGGQMSANEAQALREISPGRKLVDVETVARLAAFLASPDAFGINGQVIDVDDGGLLALASVVKKFSKRRA
ncbi:MAG: SDR family oxidoreductase [Alphaproteobacteria bacterium]|nr:SDR family oxidoreductase [Alphaproteobacteria bacterium]